MIVNSPIEIHRNRATVKLWLFICVFSLLGTILPVTVYAVTTISQGYTTTDKLSVGSIVSVQDNSSDQVNAATTDNLSNIVGVVINNSSTLLSLSTSQANQIQVASNGVVPVLVSNINGSVSRGDQITASPIKGVGMKATNSAKVVGVAQENLLASDGSTQSYADPNGHTHTVMIGEIPILLNVSYYYKQPEKTLIPSAIQNLANALAGKPVNSLPILISMGIFIVMMIIVISMVYSMIHSSIISVGRNPMAQSAVYRNLVQMSTLIIGILGAGIISIYMVLAKF